MELDRLRYSLSKYLRTRLRKVERDALHVLATADGEMQGRLSDRCGFDWWMCRELAVAGGQDMGGAVCVCSVPGVVCGLRRGFWFGLRFGGE